MKSRPDKTWIGTDSGMMLETKKILLEVETEKNAWEKTRPEYHAHLWILWSHNAVSRIGPQGRVC